MSSPHFSRNHGFTLAETLVAVAVFAIVVSLAAGGFVQALRTQKQLEGVIAANSNASLVIEQVAREIRTGRAYCADDTVALNNIDNPFLDAGRNCDPDDNNQSATLDTSIDFFNFKNASNTFVEYSFRTEGGIGYIARQEQDLSKAMSDWPILRLTAENVNVEYLEFRGVGWGRDAYNHGRVTILIGISSKESGVDRNVTNFQTTVSSRGGGNSL